MAWFHCRVPLHDSSGSDRDPMESVGLASQAGWQMRCEIVRADVWKKKQPFLL